MDNASTPPRSNFDLEGISNENQVNNSSIKIQNTQIKQRIPESINNKGDFGHSEVMMSDSIQNLSKKEAGWQQTNQNNTQHQQNNNGEFSQHDFNPGQQSNAPTQGLQNNNYDQKHTENIQQLNDQNYYQKKENDGQAFYEQDFNQDSHYGNNYIAAGPSSGDIFLNLTESNAEANYEMNFEEPQTNVEQCENNPYSLRSDTQKQGQKIKEDDRLKNQNLDSTLQNLYSPSKRHPESSDPNMIFHDFKDFPDKKWEPYLDNQKCPRSSYVDVRELENGDRMDRLLKGGSNRPLLFDLQNCWLKGEQYAHILQNQDEYCSTFGIAKYAQKQHPESIYIDPHDGLLYFVEGASIGSDFGFPRLGIRKRFKWKKMNFTTDLPKRDPLVSYIVASAVKCEKFFPGSNDDGPVYRMHAVILKKRDAKLDLPATIEAHNNSLRNGLDCDQKEYYTDNNDTQSRNTQQRSSHGRVLTKSSKIKESTLIQSSQGVIQGLQTSATKQKGAAVYDERAGLIGPGKNYILCHVRRVMGKKEEEIDSETERLAKAQLLLEQNFNDKGIEANNLNEQKDQNKNQASQQKNNQVRQGDQFEDLIDRKNENFQNSQQQNQIKNKKPEQLPQGQTIKLFENISFEQIKKMKIATADGKPISLYKYKKYILPLQQELNQQGSAILPKDSKLTLEEFQQQQIIKILKEQGLTTLGAGRGRKRKSNQDSEHPHQQSSEEMEEEGSINSEIQKTYRQQSVPQEQKSTQKIDYKQPSQIKQDSQQKSQRTRPPVPQQTLPVQQRQNEQKHQEQEQVRQPDDTASMGVDEKPIDKNNSVVTINVPSRDKQMKQSSEENKNNEQMKRQIKNVSSAAVLNETNEKQNTFDQFNLNNVFNNLNNIPNNQAFGNSQYTLAGLANLGFQQTQFNNQQLPALAGLANAFNIGANTLNQPNVQPNINQLFNNNGLQANQFANSNPLFSLASNQNFNQLQNLGNLGNLNNLNGLMGLNTLNNMGALNNLLSYGNNNNLHNQLSNLQLQNLQNQNLMVQLPTQKLISQLQDQYNSQLLDILQNASKSNQDQIIGQSHINEQDTIRNVQNSGNGRNFHENEKKREAKSMRKFESTRLGEQQRYSMLPVISPQIKNPRNNNNNNGEMSNLSGLSPQLFPFLLNGPQNGILNNLYGEKKRKLTEKNEYANGASGNILNNQFGGLNYDMLADDIVQKVSKEQARRFSNNLNNDEIGRQSLDGSFKSNNIFGNNFIQSPKFNNQFEERQHNDVPSSNKRKTSIMSHIGRDRLNSTFKKFDNIGLNQHGQKVGNFGGMNGDKDDTIQNEEEQANDNIGFGGFNTSMKKKNDKEKVNRNNESLCNKVSLTFEPSFGLGSNKPESSSATTLVPGKNVRSRATSSVISPNALGGFLGQNDKNNQMNQTASPTPFSQYLNTKNLFSQVTSSQNQAQNTNQQKNKDRGSNMVDQFQNQQINQQLQQQLLFQQQQQQQLLINQLMGNTGNLPDIFTLNQCASQFANNFDKSNQFGNMLSLLNAQQNLPNQLSIPNQISLLGLINQQQIKPNQTNSIQQASTNNNPVVNQLNTLQQLGGLQGIGALLGQQQQSWQHLSQLNQPNINSANNNPQNNQNRNQLGNGLDNFDRSQGMNLPGIQDFNSQTNSANSNINLFTNVSAQPTGREDNKKAFLSSLESALAANPQSAQDRRAAGLTQPHCSFTIPMPSNQQVITHRDSMQCNTSFGGNKSVEEIKEIQSARQKIMGDQINIRYFDKNGERQDQERDHEN